MAEEIPKASVEGALLAAYDKMLEERDKLRKLISKKRPAPDLEIFKPIQKAAENENVCKNTKSVVGQQFVKGLHI